MAATAIDLRAKIAQQDAALQAMAQHLEKFKDFELESSVKITEELAQALEVQNRLRLRNELLLRTVHNQAYAIELLVTKRALLVNEINEAQQYSNRLQCEFEEQLSSREAAYALLHNQLRESKAKLDAAEASISRLESDIKLDALKASDETQKLEERLSASEQESSHRLQTLQSLHSSHEDELARIRQESVSSKSSHLAEIENIRRHYESEIVSVESSFHDRLVKLDAENEGLRSKIAALETEFETRAESSRDKERQLSSQLGSAQDTISRLETQLESLRLKSSEEKSLLEERVSLLENESSNQLHAVESLHKHEVSKLQHDLQSTTDSYTKEINELKVNCESHVRLSERLSAIENESAARLESMQCIHEKEVAQLKNDLEIAKASHEEEICSLRRQFDSQIESLHGGLCESIQELEAENDRLRSLVIDSEHAVEANAESNRMNTAQMISEIGELKAKIERLEAQLDLEHAKFSEEKSVMQERVSSLERESLELLDPARSSYEHELAELRQTVASNNASYSEELTELQRKSETKIESIRGEMGERIIELEAENEKLLSMISEVDQFVAKHSDCKQKEHQLVSELETSLLECEQLLIVNNALKVAQKQAVEDARRFQARIKKLSSEVKSKKELESTICALRSMLETTAVKVRKLCSALSAIPSAMESSFQSFELQVSGRIATFTDRLEKGSVELSNVQKNFQVAKTQFIRDPRFRKTLKNHIAKHVKYATNDIESKVSERLSSYAARLLQNSEKIAEISDTFQLMQSQYEHDIYEFEKVRQDEHSGFQRIVDCSQAKIDELLCTRVQLEQHIVNISRELEFVNRKFDHASECLARELLAQSEVHSLFESLQFQTMHLVSSLQHDVDDLTHLSRMRGETIIELEQRLQQVHIKHSNLAQLQDSTRLDRHPIIVKFVNNPTAEFVFADVINRLKPVQRLSDLYQNDIPIHCRRLFEEISRIVLSETTELKARHEQTVDGLLNQLRRHTGSCSPVNRDNCNSIDDISLSHSFHEVLKIIESECFPPGRFSYELQQLSDMFQQACTLPTDTDVAPFHEPYKSLTNAGRRCEKCGTPSHLPIYCKSCKNFSNEISVTEQATALQQVCRARHDLQDEVSQLRACLNKAAAAITELEIRLQEATIEKTRLLDDFERANKEKQAYVNLLEESVNEIHLMEETERDLRNAHRSVDEELHRSKVLLIGEGRAKQIFSRRVRMLQDTLSLTRAELQQYKLDCARLDTLNKQYLSELEAAQATLSSQSLQVSPKMLQDKVSQLENDFSNSQLRLTQMQESISSYKSKLDKTQSQNELLTRTLFELKMITGRGLRGMLQLIPQMKEFIVEYVQGEARALSNHCHSLLKLIGLDRHAVLHLQARLSDLNEKDLLQSQALARAGRQLKEFQIVLSAQSTQIQSLKHQLRRSEEANAHSLRDHTVNSQIAYKRLPSERDIS